MRVQKTEKINFLRFRNFGWETGLGAFSDKANILFGWNGSGKTTLSRLMRMLETGIVPPDCKFKIKTDTQTISESDPPLGRRGDIRVFNDEYVSENLNGSSNIAHIFFAGKDAVDYSMEEAKLVAKRDEVSKLTLPSTHTEIAKNTAKLIKEVAGINSHRKELTGGATYAAYTQDDFEKRVGDIRSKIEGAVITSHLDLIKTETIATLKKQLVDSSIITQVDAKISSAAKWLIDNLEQINRVLSDAPTQVKSERVSTLTLDQSGWVREGVSIHFGVEPNLEHCLFCESRIENSAELLQHFSEAVVKASAAVGGYLTQIEKYTTDLAGVLMVTDEQRRRILVLRSDFDALTPALREKQNAISQARAVVVIDLEALAPFVDSTPINATEIAYEIEKHYVAEQFEAYAAAKKEYDEAVKIKKTLEGEAVKLEEQVNTLKQKAKNTHEPAKNLNRLFKVAFPHRNIEIVENADSTGYALKRDGEPCSFSSLSEGEKNFIALAYFVYSLNDAQNKLSDTGVVVIDDPVSSLDKQAIFQIFSIIVSEIRNRSNRQYFLLTHNLDFFGHLKEEFAKKISDGVIQVYGLEATLGGCVITEIPKLLRDHRSDYYYVFSVLHGHVAGCDMADAHLMVNLLRRWLETFLEFKFASAGDYRSTLDLAYREAASLSKDSRTPFSENSLEMYRFTNHGSHGFPDTESTDDSILTNAHLRIQEAFRLIEILDPLHYKKLNSLAP